MVKHWTELPVSQLQHIWFGAYSSLLTLLPIHLRLLTSTIAFHPPSWFPPSNLGYDADINCPVLLDVKEPGTFVAEGDRYNKGSLKLGVIISIESHVLASLPGPAGALTPCPVPGLIVLGDIHVLYTGHLHVSSFGCMRKDLFLACIFNPLESMLAEDAKKAHGVHWCYFILSTYNFQWN